jgi:hypothetical protein
MAMLSKSVRRLERRKQGSRGKRVPLFLKDDAASESGASVIGPMPKSTSFCGCSRRDHATTASVQTAFTAG